MLRAALTTDSLSFSSTSSGLIERVKIHDDHAWQQLLKLYGPLVYSWCRRANLRPDDAGDVVQEVFRSVFVGIAAFRREGPGDTFRGWLRVICRNQICDHYRQRPEHCEAVGGSEALVRLQQVADRADDLSEATGEISGLVRRAAHLIRNEFEERTWQAFWLTAVEERSSIEAAAELGLSPGAVRQAKYKVLRRLRDQLGDA